MAYTYEELKGKTVQELREIAKDVKHDAVQGFSQMNKEHLLPANPGGKVRVYVVVNPAH